MTHTARPAAVVLCCDRTFLPFAAHLANQIARQGGGFDICICSDETLALPESLAHLPVRMVHLPPDDAYLRLDSAGDLPRSTYLRLWAAERLSGEYRRLLYLDSDIWLEEGAGLPALLALDLGGRPLAAVRDALQWRRPERLAGEFAALGWGPLPYFNAGVLLIDGPGWAGRGVLTAAIEFAAREPQAMTQRDQSQLNALFRGAWAELHPCWNWQWAATRPLWDSIAQVRLAHFGGTRKPWRDPDGLCPPRYRAGYSAFFDAHFPELRLPPPPSLPALRRRGEVAAMAAKVVRDLPAVNRYLDRFAGPLDLLTP